MYVIANWAKHFECNRTRELKTMAWVPVPNRHDGDGYTELLDHPEGPSHFGAWCALVQVASKCDPRGTLLRDTGKAHDAGSLSRMTRFPRAVIESALPRLVEIGWIVITPDITPAVVLTCDPPQESASIPQEGAVLGPHKGALNGMEGNGMEWNGKREREPSKSGSFDELIISEIERLKAANIIPPTFNSPDTIHEIARWLVYYPVQHDGKKFNDFQLVAQLRKSMQERKWSSADLQKSIDFSIGVGAKNWLDPANDKDKQNGSSYADRLATPSSALALPVRS